MGILSRSLRRAGGLGARLAPACAAAAIVLATSAARADDATPDPNAEVKPETITGPIAERTNVPFAISMEVLSPVGGAGCFYRRRYVAGAIVVAGSLISGGTLIYATAQHDKDPIIINAVAFAVMRVIGIAAAARPDELPALPPVVPASLPADPTSPRAAALPSVPSRMIGLSHAFAF